VVFFLAEDVDLHVCPHLKLVRDVLLSLFVLGFLMDFHHSLHILLIAMYISIFF
jgi:hypothetical protein